MYDLVALVALLAGMPAIDAFAKPSRAFRLYGRSLPGTVVNVAGGVVAFGLMLLITGVWLTSAVIVLTAAIALSSISNIKRNILGEPLVFTDFALLVAVFEQPQFYLSALKRWQLWALALVATALCLGLAAFSSAELRPRAIGIGIILAGVLLLRSLLALPTWWRVAIAPDLERDVLVHGLSATLLVYWFLWLRLPRPMPAALPAVACEPGQIVIVVQCESFSDPEDLFGPQDHPLAGLETARSLAWRSGRLMVPGFGAYTMRTEFGVLFGIEEPALGLRRFDPYLTARDVAGHALASRMAEVQGRRLFVHPHDLRFYGRDKLMPAAGFDSLIGERAFAPPDPATGRYVSDLAVCDKLLELARSDDPVALAYAVTIENHGPWAAGGEDNKASYLRCVRRSDAMLSRLIDGLSVLGRPAVLCFFGDHRPSIPGVSEPGGDRFTPYVIIRFDGSGRARQTARMRKDLTPAQLHHELLAAIGSRAGER